MSLGSKTQDPSDILDYTVNWGAFLLGDTITTSAWTVSTGLTSVLETNSTTAATIWISGGQAGVSYTVTNTIMTAGGRTAERSFTLIVNNL
jgi:hypothetical protein